MIPEFLLETDENLRITFYRKDQRSGFNFNEDHIEIEEFDNYNSFNSRVVLSIESFREIQSNLDKWEKDRKRKEKGDGKNI